jgi:predicted glycoside hydrolase/deacetylase ChbG (UPF0249 family)
MLRARVLIVNADDFGRSVGVNRGVALAHEKGIVTSASLMVRRHAAVEAAAYAKLHPRLSIGLHVDLGEWIYRDGNWEAVDEISGPADEEVHRQLVQFRQFVGRDPTHLDSHQHVHRDPPVRSLLAELAQDLGVPLRGNNARVRYCGDFYGQAATGQALPDAIGVPALIDLLAILPAGVTELSCHPGLDSDHDLPYGKERSIEVQALCDPRVRATITAGGIRLQSFADLALNRSNPQQSA